MKVSEAQAESNSNEFVVVICNSSIVYEGGIYNISNNYLNMEVIEYDYFMDLLFMKIA